MSTSEQEPKESLSKFKIQKRLKSYNFGGWGPLLKVKVSTHKTDTQKNLDRETSKSILIGMLNSVWYE